MHHRFTALGPRDDTEFAAVSIENVFDIIPTRTWPVHFGAYAEYEFKTGDGPDELELKLLMQRARANWSFTANLIGEREIGDDAGGDWEFGYATEAAYALNDDMKLGVQGFGDAGTSDDFGEFGDRAHYWGPFTEFELGHVAQGEVELGLGYVIGFGESEADGQFRLKLEFEFGGDH